MNYEQAGVSVKQGDLFVEGLHSLVTRTYDKNVKAGIGGFAALYEQGENYLVAGTDGVGTKLKLAMELGIHHSIGQDLVGMCINDILCSGAQPLFFLDYLATGKLTPEIHHQVVKGIANACFEASCALIGGETAEMPGMYQGEEYDLAGFVVGQVPKNELIDGSQVQADMTIMALRSSGFHSNGYSLIRHLLRDEGEALKQQCITPTRLYGKEVKKLLKTKAIFGMSHITGGGLNNIKRINSNFGYHIDHLPDLPDYMQYLLKKSQLAPAELYTTFNMGIGFCFITDSPQKLKTLLPELIEIGVVTRDNGVNCLGTHI